jgi:hypothetical protein
LINF